MMERQNPHGVEGWLMTFIAQCGYNQMREPNRTRPYSLPQVRSRPGWRPMQSLHSNSSTLSLISAYVRLQYFITPGWGSAAIPWAELHPRDRICACSLPAALAVGTTAAGRGWANWTFAWEDEFASTVQPRAPLLVNRFTFAHPPPGLPARLDASFLPAVRRLKRGTAPVHAGGKQAHPMLNSAAAPGRCNAAAAVRGLGGSGGWGGLQPLQPLHQVPAGRRW